MYTSDQNDVIHHWPEDSLSLEPESLHSAFNFDHAVEATFWLLYTYRNNTICMYYSHNLGY